MAADQRYCVDCGHRRGEPLLPFMDAVTSVGSPDAPGGAGRTPPPPRSRRGDAPRRPSANAALIAGVATLILAIGVGFLIGRAGHEGGSSGSQGTEKITIEGGGAAPQSPSTPLLPAPGIAPKHGGGDGPQSRESPGGVTEPKKAPEHDGGSKKQEEEEEAEQENQATLHPKVPLPKPKARIGDTCETGTPGCGKNKKFNGVFFGGEE
jgi:hypothetical protein